MRYSPELVVFHVPPFTSEMNAEIKKAYRYGVGKGALVQKWLLKGEFKVFFELCEMLIMPFLRIPIFVLTLKFNEVLILFSAFLGRVKGLFL